MNKMVSSIENEASFYFRCVTVDDISKEIKQLNIKKATRERYTSYIKILIPVLLKVSSLMVIKKSA